MLSRRTFIATPVALLAAQAAFIRNGEIQHVHFQDVPDIPRETLDNNTRVIPGDGIAPIRADPEEAA